MRAFAGRCGGESVVRFEGNNRQLQARTFARAEHEFAGAHKHSLTGDGRRG
jgi:hypothetical protein